MADSINGYNIPSLQNNKPVNFQQTVVTPQMQGMPVDQEKLKQAANDNYISNRVKASEGDNPFTKLGFGLGIWYAIAQLMDKINPKMGGKFEESLGGKVASVGDRLSNTSVGKFIDRSIGWMGRKVTWLAERSKIVNALKNFSTNPEWGFAKMPKLGLFGFWSMDAGQVLESYLKPIGTNAQKLEQYGLSQAEIDNFARTLTGDKASKMLALQKKELELLGADPKVLDRIRTAAERTAKRELSAFTSNPGYAELLKELEQTKQMNLLQKYAQSLKVKDMGIFKGKGIKGFKDFKAADNPDKILEIFDNLAKKHPDWKVSIWRGNISSFWGKLKSHLFGRTVSFSEYRNKGLIATGKGGATRLGRLMSKSFGWFMEGMTNRFGGGKLAVGMQAFIFAEMAMATIKAPWGEKFKTGAERVVNDFSYFIGLTLGLIGMHKIGGLKYVGLKDNAAVELYRNELKALNAKNDAGLFASKKEWKDAVKNLNNKYLGRENIKNPITKLLQRIGTFINIGNERIHSYKSTAKYNMNWLRKIKNGNIIGVPLRIWLGMGVAVPFIAKWATKGVHAIFGRPTHSVLDEEEEEPEKAPASQQAQPTVQQTAIPAIVTQAAVQPKSPQEYKSDTNLIKQKVTAQAAVQPKSPQVSQSDTNLIKQRMGANPQFTGSLESSQDHPTVEDYKRLYPDSNYVKQTINGQYPPSVTAYTQTAAAAAATQQAVRNNDGVQHPTWQEYQNYPNTNYIKMTLNGQYPPKNQTAGKEMEPLRTYIPSPECKVTNNVDLTPAEKALADADNAEKFINDTLSQIK